MLLLDQLLTMLPQMTALYGERSTGAPHFFSWMFQQSNWNWSLLQGIGDGQALQLAMWVWMGATICLLLGWNTRAVAIVVWVLSVSFTNLNVNSINAGDHIRGILLMYLMLTPCGAAWSIDAWRRRRMLGAVPQIFVHPWALRLLLVQLSFMYSASGICKLSGESWTHGDSLYYVMQDLTLTRFSPQQLELPIWLTQIATWSVLAWETLFPLLVWNRRTRVASLWFGVSMHVGILITMELGGFPLYLLAAYVPLILEEYYGGDQVLGPFGKFTAPERLATTARRVGLLQIGG
nr:HTTM domain-containing protein [Lignipirellula cremea]